MGRREESCGRCLWWKGEASDVNVPGECHRHAPAPKPATQPEEKVDWGYHVVWPLTFFDDFCGDFRPAAPAAT
jgi:hypothetical protein